MSCRHMSATTCVNLEHQVAVLKPSTHAAVARLKKRGGQSKSKQKLYLPCAQDASLL